MSTFVKYCLWLIVCEVAALDLVESKVFPVYSAGLSGNSGKSLFVNNETLEVDVSSGYTVELPAESRSFVTKQPEGSWANGEEEDELVTKERISCLASQRLSSCWRYKALRFVQYLLQPMGVPTIRNFSTGRSFNEPQLVAMPTPSGNLTLVILGRAGNSGLGEALGFLERQFSRFLTRHGVVFTAVSYDDTFGDNKRIDAPILLGDEDSESPEGRSTQRKVKRKSVLFPLLVLFKFFKIKMVLLPILLTVLAIKKLLIIALALAPNIIGLFRLCRPGVPGFTPPFGLASAGILQEVGDSRGEFSTLYNTYASPYRDTQGYRTRQYGRYSGNTASPEREEPLPDY